MSDILKISAPVLKNTHVVQRNIPDPTIPFQIKDVSKVNNLNQTKETNAQNQTMVSGDGPTLLLQMLNDPLGSIQFIKSMFLLQEVVSMLPLANKVISKEIEKLLEDLLLRPEDLVQELLKQEAGSSVFQGELFESLRGFLETYPEHKEEVVLLLKHLNGQLQKENYRESVKSNLLFFIEKFEGLSLQAPLQQLYERFASGEDFASLQDDLQQVFAAMEQSILFSPKLEKNISILQYNISRLLPDVDIDYMLAGFKTVLDPKSFAQLKTQLIAFQDGFDLELASKNNNKVMQILTRLIEVQVANKVELGMSPDKIERIIYSLLASPSNFTPLMHFILPLDFQGLQAFGELWIDPNPEDAALKEKSDAYQMLLAIEVDRLGHFELDVQVVGKQLRVRLFTPLVLQPHFEKNAKALRDILVRSPYRLEAFEVLGIEKPRTLMEVFKRLPSRRSGVSVYA
ncbi:MAG: hypothetical protein ACRCZJ_05085 [Erysipelotrichaceae bacterium]